MEILLIIVVGVIISVISAAGKKKPNRSSDEDAPVRPNMSDIQKAFMMANDAPPRRTPQTRQPAATTSMATAHTIPEKATERLSARTFETVPVSNADMSRNKYANIDLGSFQAGSIDPGDDLTLEVKKRQHGTLNLFEDKNDLVRAVIYSEILTRKAR